MIEGALVLRREELFSVQHTDDKSMHFTFLSTRIPPGNLLRRQ